ncbi:hypothetical protein BKA00_000133 [Actinomadura coerulea]|uniref:Ricin B lectin domain-containing protein n=1 Tax=Actinomadura coerulea TaxID=46159 RepID=A0A7X0FT49_9ACTN|nr:hypothetical protein [Actinomadura coerulea]MBB6393219.1 hypothetical protein [Actinomadura coerulea]GGQ33807.1 hypothetical protein GCM10010187_58460 [Actinomadura coerulea]
MQAPRAVPHPEEARDPADLLDLMRRLQQWSGLPLSELEERMNADGVVAPSGLDALLSGRALPSRGLVTAFLATCGLVPDERTRWLRVYDRLCGPAAVEGDRRVAGRPALNRGPAAPPDPPLAPPPVQAPAPALASAPPSGSGSSGSGSSGSGSSGRHAASPPGPRHRKKSPRGNTDRRPVSLLVAAPAIITLGVVVTTLAGVFGGGGEGRPHRPQASPGAPRSATPPAGWYTIMPITGERTGDCLSILPDEELNPQLAQDKCVAEDRLQRIWLASVPSSAGTFQLKAWTPKGKLWCTTLDKKTERATLHMKSCGDDDPLQRFGLAPAGKPVKGGQPFNIVPEATRDHDMCMGVDIRISGGLETILASCGNTGVRGFLFTPAAEP